MGKLLKKFDLEGDFYGHFGDGCLHTRITFDLVTAEGLRKYRAFIDEATDLVVRFGGSFSGEHGDGLCRSLKMTRVCSGKLPHYLERKRTLFFQAVT